MTPSDLTSPSRSATATAIVSAWTSKPTNFTLFIDRLLSLVALYCRSSDSQHNPRLRIGAGHSIVTNVGVSGYPDPSGECTYRKRRKGRKAERRRFLRCAAEPVDSLSFDESG